MAARRSTADRLDRYHAKRDFSHTAEPRGGDAPAVDGAVGGRFVVQRHRARRLHYDVRLELDGVLVSWAVPKGPTLDPRARHLAVHVEDHPLEYIDFEGVIPAGEYGGGDVIVWDRGTWTPAGKDPAEGLATGDLHVDLHGEKLRGRFVFVRRDGRRGSRGGKEQWLLLHKRDDHAVDGWDPEDHPRSVRSGRTNDEVAADPAAASWSGEVDAAAQRTWPAPTDQELAALDALGRAGEWRIGAETVRLTNLDKVLFPGRPGEEPVTKRDLVRYSAQVAPFLLPYVVDRPINLHRFPDGSAGKSFWHKALPTNAPEWMGRWRNEAADPGETEWYAVLDRPAALVFMANHGALELHPWTSTTRDPREPTWALIDIDPGPAVDFDDVVTLARLYRTALDHLEVQAGPKVTGKRGIQIWVPVARGYTFDDTRAWVETVSRAVGATVPELVSWKWHTREREGLARLDYTQNAINKTLVAPFSTRPAPGAPVSVPITWDELDDPDLAPDRWTLRTVLDRVAAVGDPLRPLVGRQQRLPDL